ncbi:MAG: hypothetical protein WC460_01505 [Patescibacteria group bacterium]
MIYTDTALLNLNPADLAQADDAEINALRKLLHQMWDESKGDDKKYHRAIWELWGSLSYPFTSTEVAEYQAERELTPRQAWIKNYNERFKPDSDILCLSDAEFDEVFRLLLRPYSEIYQRLDELTSKRWNPFQAEYLYELEHMTFPICKRDSWLVSKIMQYDLDDYKTRILPHLGLKTEWQEESDAEYEEYLLELSNRSLWRKSIDKLRSWKWRIKSLFQKRESPWEQPGIQQALTGSIYEQSPSAYVQLRFRRGYHELPDLVFVPLVPLEYFRLSFNGHALCGYAYGPCYSEYGMLDMLDNFTGNDDDWRFMDGFSYEFNPVNSFPWKDELPGNPDRLSNDHRIECRYY